MQVVNSNLISIEERPGTNNQTRRGSTLTRPILIRNRSNQNIEIDFWIDVTDTKSEALLPWCNFSEQSPLKLNANEVKEVILKFQIPASAIPDLYTYEIRVEAGCEYSGLISRRPQQLRVLPSDKDTISKSNEPRFSIQPISSSTNPLVLEAGKQVEIKISVENRSRWVDRFYLCPEFTPEFTSEWYTVKYPESDLDIPGLVKETDGLQLNPGCKGEIDLILHPPKYTPAGNYCPTIRLISSKREELVLLDIIYLHILPEQSLDVRIHPQEQKIPQESGKFEIDLINLGNITRKLKITAKDEEEIFSYPLEPAIVKILPGETKTVELKANPKKWWVRGWKGKPLAIPFHIQLENIDSKAQLSLPQQLPQGKLIWQSRTWWLLWLFILLGLLGISGIAFAIWWNLFGREIPTPQVENFETTYKTDEKDTEFNNQNNQEKNITLAWSISNRKQVEKVTVIQMQDNKETHRKNYIFKNQTPKECSWSFIRNIDNPSNKTQTPEYLSCKNINTKANQAGNYTFKIEVFSKENLEKPVSSQITDTVTIPPATPLPIPKIDKFESTKPAYQEKNPDLSLENNLDNDAIVSPIVLNWEISNPSNVEKFEIIGLAPDGSISSKARTFELNDKKYQDDEGNFSPQKFKQEECEAVPNQNTQEIEREIKESSSKLSCLFKVKDAQKAGDYTFKMTLIPKGGNEENAIVKQTPLIKVQPIDTPQILSFLPASPTYQQPGIVNNIETATDSRPGFPPIRLNWQITNPSKIKELQIIGTNDGSLSEYQRYAMSEGIPLLLKNNCKKQEDKAVLDCSMVKTKAIKPGSYTFKIVALLKEGENNTEIIKATEAIKIQPKFAKPSEPATPIKIVSFKVNGQEASSNPKQTFAINKQRTDASIALSWQVEKGEDIKVELLPAPGLVEDRGFIEYPLNSSPGNETITLKVTNKDGEEKIQTVVIQTVESIPPGGNQSSTTGNTNSDNNNSGANTPASFQRSTPATDSATPSTPTNSDSLSPIELPPTAE